MLASHSDRDQCLTTRPVKHEDEDPPLPPIAKRPKIKLEEDVNIFVTPASWTRFQATWYTDPPIKVEEKDECNFSVQAATTSTPSPQYQHTRTGLILPPPSNPLGPAAQPPYLPAKSEYGGPDIFYSPRPRGPRIYDLLNTLPLEPYGLLAWKVVEAEDAIFEVDDVKDEYKVMHALWGRWIMLNTNKFIKDYYKGIKSFIDYYWKMIHRAAGWDALRYWLLMLVVNRFITGAEVARLLKHYESLTGMETWYK